MTVTPLLIPTRSNSAHYSQTTTLDGKAYRLEFDWVQRSNQWTISVLSASGVSLLRGAALLVGNDVLAPHRWDVRLPPGSLGVFDAQASGKDPGLLDFGIHGPFVLIYVPQETEEISSSTTYGTNPPAPVEEM